MNYRDNKNSYTKSFKDAVEQAEKQEQKEAKKLGGEGEVIDNLVKKIIGKETNQLKKAKLIHNWLIKNVSYKYYSCGKYKTAEEAYNNRGHLNCADTARLTRAMMSSAGLDAYVVHGPNHFWTVIKISGKEYASDATSKKRKWNTVYKNLKYSKKNGKNPSC